MIHLSAFADEISADPVEQFDCLDQNGIRFIEFRSIHGTNVLDLTPEQHDSFRSLLKDRGFQLSAIASPVGKSSITEPFAMEQKRLDKAIELAVFYGTPNIRVFSFYPPPDSDPADSRAEVLHRMETMTRSVADRGLRLVLENEKGLYGDTASRLEDILGAIEYPSLGLAFDPANFLEVGQDVSEAWQQLCHRVVHFHVKDFDVTLKKNVVAGAGDGQIPRLIADAVTRGYEGFCTLEPHLLIAAHSHGFTGPVRFGEAATALKTELQTRDVAFG